MIIERSAEQSPAVFAKVLLGMDLHPGQVEWLENRARVKVACCGRRWGKSFSTSADLLWFAFAHPGTQQMLIAPTYDQAATIFNYCEQLLSNSPLARWTEKIVRSPFSEIRVAGSSIHARSAGESGRNVRSKGADRLIEDEASFIPEAARAALSPLLATSKYAEQVYISTPFGKNFFWELFLKGQAGTPGYASFQYPSSSSPYVSTSFLDQERHQMTAMQFAVEYEAQFIDDQNSVFPWSLIERCVAGQTQDPILGHRYVVGYDPAKFVDRSGVVVLDVTNEIWQAVAIEDISGRDYIEHQVPAVKALAQRYNNAMVLLDSTHNEALLELFRHERVRVEGYAFSNPSKQELINGLVIAMEKGRLQFPSHQDLMTELMYYRYELTAAGNVRLGADSQHHDDLVTALALAVYQAAHTKRITGNRAAAGPARPILNDYVPR